MREYIGGTKLTQDFKGPGKLHICEQCGLEYYCVSPYCKLPVKYGICSKCV